ncbi:MAG: HD domain-containing protein [Asgard group archaeon]|nr:HD domain-containing protein [Asgard group archaeon]
MTEKMVEFFQNTIRLKRMLRNGWVSSGVPPSAVESVADHSFMVAIISLILALADQEKNTKVDIEKVLIMALLHDLSESVTQDINRCVKKFSPDSYDNFKSDLDKNATSFLLEFLPTKQAEYLSDIHQEFVKRESKEAIIVHNADRLETLMQLQQYREIGLSKQMFSAFFDTFEQEINNYDNELVKALATQFFGLSNNDK